MSGRRRVDGMDAPALALCIGCRCDDDHACPGGCSWLVVDRNLGLGVCSQCPSSLGRFHPFKRGLFRRTSTRSAPRQVKRGAP
jgi:hypothetical protein